MIHGSAAVAIFPPSARFTAQPARRNGFTLIELLVVISIVALLVAILLPALSSAKEQSRRVRCASNLRQWGIMLVAYDEDFRNLPPGRFNIQNYVGNSTATDAHDTLRDSYNMPEPVTLCPSGAPWTNNTGVWGVNGDVGRLQYYYLVGHGGRAASPIGNVQWFGDTGWLRGAFESGSHGYHPVMSLTKATPHRASETLMMFDTSYIVQPHGQMPTRANHLGPAYPAGGNSLFADGHVEWHAWISGQSWIYLGNAGDPNTSVYWTPKFDPPIGAAFFP